MAGGTGGIRPSPSGSTRSLAGSRFFKAPFLRLNHRPPARKSYLIEPSTIVLTSVKQQATVCQVKIRNFVHKGLKRLYAEDIAKGVPPDTVNKLRKMLAFLDDMQDPRNYARSGRGRPTR
jgi:hypothetical protein